MAARALLLLAASLVVSAGAAALVQAERHPELSIGGAGAWAGALQLAAGLGACAAGADLALRRALWLPGGLLATSGLALLLGSAPLSEPGGAALFTAALAFGTFAPVLAGAAAVSTPVIGRIDAALLAAVLADVLVLGLLVTATFDPVATGCFACPRNLMLVHGAPSLRAALLDAAPVVESALCAVLAAVAVARWAAQPVLVRRAVAPVVLGGALTATLGCAAFAHTTRFDGMARALWLAQCAVLALVAAAIGIQAWRSRALRERIGELVVATLPSPERLRDGLAVTLDDPSLVIAFPGARSCPVDAAGAPARAPAADMAITEVTRGEEVVALLYHDVALTHSPERLAAAARGAGPALQHASLRARLRAEVDELRASRMRVVEVSDDARRRAERNLHDGAQQRLIALSVALAQHSELGRAGEELRRALEDLRTLAHGIHPASLTDGGVVAAIGELAERCRVPLELLEVSEDRAPAATESAIYRLVLDGVGCAERHGDGGTVTVAIAGAVSVQLALPGVRRAQAALELAHAADRIAALDGTLSIIEATDGVRVQALVPCAS
jgi:signal transduction histidine kinase